MKKSTLKALTLVAMGLFFYSRFWSGNLFFYIHERFLWLIIFASIGFVVLGISYTYLSARQDPEHTHDGHHHASFSWGSLFLLALPIVLGLLVPPKPLGAAAMVNRDVSAGSLTSATAPGRDNILNKPKGEKTILDWLIEFRTSANPARFDGEEIKATGFVYRDDRFGPDTFMVSRFVVSCCAADAAPVGLIVKSPDSANFAADQWVEVSGRLELSQFDGQEMPIIIADAITPVDVPERPYLYPF